MKRDIIIAIIAGTVLFLTLVLSVFNFLLLYIKRRKQHIEDIVKIKYEFGEELLKAQLEIQEQTLKNISQEIHDNVGQTLSLAKLNLNMMDTTRVNQLQGKIDNTLTQVSKAINDLRDLSKSFNTDNITAIGLIRAIEYELEIISKTDSHKTVLTIHGETKRLESQKELILFRIVQETLHNIIKHANASFIEVTLTYSDIQLILQVIDDGKGFDLAPVNKDGDNGFGLGIRNMHNRAKLIGAEFSVNSIIGEGTTVKIVLPFENNNPKT